MGLPVKLARQSGFERRDVAAPAASACSSASQRRSSSVSGMAPRRSGRRVSVRRSVSRQRQRVMLAHIGLRLHQQTKRVPQGCIDIGHRQRPDDAVDRCVGNCREVIGHHDRVGQ